jgi:hypothetical protein
METVTTEPDDIDPDLTLLVLANLDALESLVSDLLGMMVALDPASLGELRDHAFRQVALADRIGAPTAEAFHYGAVLRNRARLLEVVVARAGSPWKGTPVIDLAEVRQSIADPCASRPTRNPAKQGSG